MSIWLAAAVIALTIALIVWSMKQIRADVDREEDEQRARERRIRSLEPLSYVPWSPADEMADVARREWERRA